MSTSLIEDENIVASNWSDLYKEICANIRTSDDISFKLLGLVPTLAGVAAGALTLLEKPVTSWGVLALAIAGFWITFGLFRWELRNVQKCEWLIARAAELESYALKSDRKPLEHIQYFGWLNEPLPRLPKWTWPWGKKEAEVAVYLAAMLAWLIPAITAIISLGSAWLCKPSA